MALIPPEDLPVRISCLPKNEADRKRLKLVCHRLCQLEKPRSARKAKEALLYESIIADAKAKVRAPVHTQRIAQLSPVRNPTGKLITPAGPAVTPVAPAPVPHGFRQAKGGLLVPGR